MGSDDTKHSTVDRTAKTRFMVAIAFILVAYLIHKSWGAINEMLQAARWEILILSVLALTTANVGIAYVFSSVAKRHVPGLGPHYQATGSFLLSQIAKYVPGKIWGVAMQTTMLRQPGATGGVIFANLELVVANVALVTGAGI